MSEAQARPMLRVWLTRLTWVIAGILLLGLLAWAGVPPLLKWQAQTRLSETLGRAVTVGDVGFKPWSLELTATDIAIAGSEPTAEPLLQVARVHADVAIASLWHLAPVIEALEIEAPRVRLVRTAPRHYDIDDLIAKFTPRAEPPDEEPSRFALYNVQLRDGAVRFADQPVGRVHEIDALQLTLPFLSNLPADVNVTVEPRLAFRLNGSAFDSGAQATPFAQTREATLGLTIDDLDLAPYLGYLPQSLPVRVVRGQISADLSAHFTQAAGQAPQLNLRGVLSVRDLALEDRSDGPLLAWQTATLVLRDVQPLVRRLGFETLRIEGARLFAARDHSGVFNGSRLATPTDTGAASKAAPAKAASAVAGSHAAAPAPAWQVSLDAFDLVDAQVMWNDAAVTPAVALQLDGVSLSARKMRWPVEAAMPLHLAGILRAQGKDEPKLGRLTIDGSATDRDATLMIELSALSLEALAPYVAQALVPTLDGRVSARGQLQWSGSAESPRLQLALENASLDGLDVRGADAGRGAASLKQLALADVQLDLLARRVTLGSVTLTEPSLTLARDRAGQLNLAQWPVASEATGPGNAAEASSTADREADSPWQVQVGDLTLQGGSLHFSDAMAIRDRSTGAPTRVDLSNLRLAVHKLQWPAERGAEPAPVELSASIATPGSPGVRAAPAGTLAWTGHIGLAPLSASGRLRIQRFALPLLEPYVPNALQVRLVRAEAGYDGTLAVHEASGGFDVDLEGDVLLGDVQINSLPGSGVAAGSTTEDELLSWQSLALNDLHFVMQPGRRPRLDIGHAALDDFYSRLVITEQGRFNLQEIATPAGANAADAASAPAAASASAPADAAASAPANAAPSPGLPIEISVGATQLANGRIDFSDHFIQPNYSAALTDLKGELGAFRSDSTEMATLQLHGRAAGTATLDVSGRLNPTADPLALDIEASVTGLELAPLSPYAGKYAGYAIERGKLSMNIAYRIDPNGRLEASNQLVLNQLTFGDKVESPDATKLPVRLAVALLKDRNGVIDIDLPISGSLNDPQFSLGGVIARLIGNLLTKALTAPFSLLAGGGSGDELSKVEFVPGTARLTERGASAIDKVAKALANRPSLEMTVTGEVDPEAERQARRRAVLDARLAAERRREGLRAGAATAPASAPQDLNAGDRERLITKLYEDSDIPDKPRNALGLAKRIALEQMEAMLLERMPAGAEAMRELALQRGLAVRDALVAKGLPSERLFLAAPKLHDGDGGHGGDGAWKPSAQLSLSVN